MERAGVTQLLDRKSFISALGHLTKISSQVRRDDNINDDDGMSAWSVSHLTVTHTFSYYAQYSAHESLLVPWTEHNFQTK